MGWSVEWFQQNFGLLWRFFHPKISIFKTDLFQTRTPKGLFFNYTDIMREHNSSK